MTATLNGRPQRKQLADQLDRLDGILDVLADALPQAVADACREGAKQAVKDAVLELLANPDVRTLLAPPAPPPPPPPAPPKPSWWQTIKSQLSAARTAVVERTKAVMNTVTQAARLLAAVLPLKRIALVAGAVGLTVGVVSLVCPPLVAAAVSAIGGAATAAAAQVTGVLRRSGLLAHPA